MDTNPQSLNRRSSMIRLLLHAGLSALFGAALFGACATGSPGSNETGTSTTDAAVEIDEHEPALVARATGEVDVFDHPGDRDATRRLPARTEFDFPTVLLVDTVGHGAADGWLEVLLPIRPSGSTGWVRADDFELREVSFTVVVDLAARNLTVLEDGAPLLVTATAVGDADHPTPTGTFYITDKLETPDPNGAYGPYALGLSAFSDVLTEFAGGNGQVGIHGTNAPSSIGQAVSHGCLRIPNDVVAELAHLLPLGTPVVIS